MRYRFFALLLIAGILLTCTGAIMKINHLADADLFLLIGLLAEGIGLSALAWFVFEYLRKKENINL